MSNHTEQAEAAAAAAAASPQALDGELLPAHQPAAASPMPQAQPPAADAANAAAADAAKRAIPQPFSRRGRSDLVKRDASQRISKRLRHAIVLMSQGTSMNQAAAKAGIHRNSLGYAMKRPHVIALLEETIRTNLAISAGKAAGRLDHLIGGAKSEYVQLEAAKAVLDRSGYTTSRSVALGGDVVIEIKL